MKHRCMAVALFISLVTTAAGCGGSPPAGTASPVPETKAEMTSGTTTETTALTTEETTPETTAAVTKTEEPEPLPEGTYRLDGVTFRFSEITDELHEDLLDLMETLHGKPEGKFVRVVFEVIDGGEYGGLRADRVKSVFGKDGRTRLNGALPIDFSYSDSLLAETDSSTHYMNDQIFPVFAVDNDFDPASAEVTVDLSGMNDLLPAPQNVKAETNTRNRNITVSWDPVEGADDYGISLCYPDVAVRYEDEKVFGNGYTSVSTKDTSYTFECNVSNTVYLRVYALVSDGEHKKEQSYAYTQFRRF